MNYEAGSEMDGPRAWVGSTNEMKTTDYRLGKNGSQRENRREVKWKLEKTK